MKFKLGQIVIHKISKKKYVLTEYYPKSLLRRYAYCRGDDGNSMSALNLYETELIAVGGKEDE